MTKSQIKVIIKLNKKFVSGENVKKVAIVTGASSGIGLATANMLKNRGYTVYGVARKSKDVDFTLFEGDVNDEVRMKEIIDEVFKKEGQIDVFVNDAGFGIGGELIDNDPQVIKSLFATNLTAYAVNTVLVSNVMKEQGHGKIINLCSLSALFPLPYQACYSASKAGVDVLTRTARTELKPYNIYVSDVLPGDVSTGFTDARVNNLSKNEKVNKSVKKMEGYERNGMSPNVVAKKICHLADAKKPRARVCVGSLKLLIFFQKILPTRFVDWLISKLYC